MKYRALVAAVVVALGLGVYAVTRPAPNYGEVGISRLTHDYLEGVAANAGVSLDSQTILAYRTDGNKAVARVRIVFTQIVYDPMTGTFVPQTTTKVVVVKFAKSVWHVSDFEPAK